MPEEIIQISEDYYVLSTSSRIDDRTRVLKYGDTFAIFDRFGDIETPGTGELGIYHQDTRFLSRFTLRLGDTRLVLLSSTIKEDNAILAVDCMNADIQRDDSVVIPRGTIHIFRSSLVWDATWYERLHVHNYSLTPVEVPLSLSFDADFVDIFEVRGMKRDGRGRRLPAQVDDAAVMLGYEGLDGRVCRTRLQFDPPPASLTESSARFLIKLEPRAEMTIDWTASCELEIDATRVSKTSAMAVAPPSRHPFEDVLQSATQALDDVREKIPQISSSNHQFNDWLGRSVVDLHTLRTETAHGTYPYAGVPWYSTVFGRDGIITALECLWLDPGCAKGVLGYLAATQATEDDPEADAEPGKMLHETRAGEMATAGETPLGRYYGTVDTTPLYIVLVEAYLKRTGDVDFVRTLMPHVDAALSWIDEHGDLDGDGFVEYECRSPHGLVNQGWKDSHDSIFHDDGTLAEGPLALCEVQGYVYDAILAASRIVRILGDEERATQLERQAESLRERFEEAFWIEDLSTYALALDGEKRPCRVRSSNAGHCLYSGIASADRARRVANTLMDETSFSGWGIRTLAFSEVRYNPMSYHNGSVWPHDNALIAAGFTRHGFREETAAVFSALFEASQYFDLHRVPELFCGFLRRDGESPTLYPVACAPQAWASGAVFFLLEACLGLRIDAIEHKIVLTRPFLPEFLQHLTISNLRVNDACVDLSFTWHKEDVGVTVTHQEGRVDVLILK